MKPLCFPPAVSHPVVLIIPRCFPIVFPVLIVTSLFLLLCLLSLPVSCPATTRSIALAFPSHSSPWFPIYPDPFPVASLAFPNSDRTSLEHIQEPYLHPDLQAIPWLRSPYWVVHQPTLISYHPTWSSTIVSHPIHSIYISPYVYYWVMVCVQDLP